MWVRVDKVVVNCVHNPCSTHVCLFVGVFCGQCDDGQGGQFEHVSLFWLRVFGKNSQIIPYRFLRAYLIGIE